MTEKKKNLSDYIPFEFSSAKQTRIGIVVSEWNDHITDSLLEGAKNCLLEHGVDAPVGPDLLAQAFRVGTVQFGHLPIIEDILYDRVVGPQFFKHFRVGGVSRFRLFPRPLFPLKPTLYYADICNVLYEGEQHARH